MSSMNTMHELFLEEIRDTYDAEHQFMQAMQQMMAKAQNPQVKQGLQHHMQETERQIKNLEQVFESLGEKPKRVTCKGAGGIISEFTSHAGEIKKAELLDGFIVGASAKGEHYEIATYRGLVEKARAMKHADAERLLSENLSMEETFAQKLEQLGKQLDTTLVQQKPELVGHAM